MAKSTPKLRATRPKNALFKPLKADFKELFKALAKGIGHTVTGKWEEIATDTIETLSAIGLATDPGELASLLIRRSATKALFDLVAESASLSLTEAGKDESSLVNQLDLSILSAEVEIDRSFLDRPTELPLIEALQVALKQWLELHGLSNARVAAIVDRFPSYFVYALNQEWRTNAKSYAPLLLALETPFTKAGEREWGWAAYSALLQRRTQEGIFDESFSLSQIFVSLNAYYHEEPTKKEAIDELSKPNRHRRRTVVSLEEELEGWLQRGVLDDTIRVVSGGPGSGKSSFARMFAARIARQGKVKVLFVPLHLIDASKDLVEEVGRFVKDEGVLVQNPLDSESSEPNLLVIFDGLDELATQGKAAAETARAFVREVEKTVERRNLRGLRLRALISGRELIVQENESEFRRRRQILTLLPYYVAQEQGSKKRTGPDDEEYIDPNNLLERDLRQQWWKNYGRLTGRNYDGLPKELNRRDLEEITSQPLLNYLVALSLTRGKLDFAEDIDLNSIYADLVAAVHERGYEKHRPYGPIRDMKLEDFARVLEEIGLAAWHGDGRTTTVREIEEHCRASGVGRLLDVFQEGAKAGVTRLLAAFFFRQYGQRPSGDPTFVFTHKSFGEYLAARRIVRAVERVARELDRRAQSPDEGWDDRDALKHWAHVCGPSSISQYLHTFLLNEVRLHKSNLAGWQTSFTRLFSYVLKHGMPMEQLQLGTFADAMFQSRNAEEGLLVALHACARVTRRVSLIEHPDPTSFGAWFRRIQGQRTGSQSALAASCLSFLNLSGIRLDIGDFYGADFQYSDLTNVGLHYATLISSRLEGADLQDALLIGSNLEHAYVRAAHLQRARLDEARLMRADFEGADLEGAFLRDANVVGTNFASANLKGVALDDIRGANLEGVRLPKNVRFEDISSRKKSQH